MTPCRRYHHHHFLNSQMFFSSHPNVMWEYSKCRPTHCQPSDKPVWTSPDKRRNRQTWGGILSCRTIYIETHGEGISRGTSKIAAVYFICSSLLSFCWCISQPSQLPRFMVKSPPQELPTICLCYEGLHVTLVTVCSHIWHSILHYINCFLSHPGMQLIYYSPRLERGNSLHFIITAPSA